MLCNQPGQPTSRQTDLTLKCSTMVTWFIFWLSSPKIHNIIVKQEIVQGQFCYNWPLTYLSFMLVLTISWSGIFDVNSGTARSHITCDYEKTKLMWHPSGMSPTLNNLASLLVGLALAVWVVEKVVVDPSSMAERPLYL